MAAADDRHRLEVAERQLALVQNFMPRLDSKVTALFAIVSAQLAVAALNLTAADLPKWYVTVPLAVFLAMVAWTYFNLYRCAFPHLEGGQASLVYFAEISKRRESDFVHQYMSVSVTDLTNDICGQIWRNSEIVSCKFKYLKAATQWAMGSLLPWAIVLIAASFSNGRVPLVGG
ncbi:MAG: hypothetical protein COC10_01035 [Sphingobium sp.]|nr:MAG: hypothetical protein COC10_01035 [Sphingobium sp.]